MSSADQWFTNEPEPIQVGNSANRWFTEDYVPPHWSEKIPQAVDLIASPITTFSELASGIPAWAAGEVAGKGSQIGSMLAGDTPEEQLKAHDVARDKYSEMVHKGLGILRPAIPSELGAKGTEIAGKGIEKGLDVFLKAANVKGDWWQGVGLEPLEETHPRAANFARLGTELAAFKFAHVSGAKAKNLIGQKLRSLEKLKDRPEVMEESVRTLVKEEITPDLEPKLLEYKPELFNEYTKEFKLGRVTEDVAPGRVRGEAPPVEQRLLPEPEAPNYKPLNRSMRAAKEKLKNDITYDGSMEQGEGIPTFHSFTFKDGPAKGGSFTVLKDGRPTALEIIEAGNKILETRKPSIQKLNKGVISPERAGALIDRVEPVVKRFAEEGVGKPENIKKALNTINDRVDPITQEGRAITDRVEYLMGEVNRRIKNAGEIREGAEKARTQEGVERGGGRQVRVRDLKVEGLETKEAVIPETVGEMFRRVKEKNEEVYGKYEDRVRAQKELEGEVSEILKKEELKDLEREQRRELEEEKALETGEDLREYDRVYRRFDKGVVEDWGLVDYGVENMAGDLYDLFVKGDSGSAFSGKRLTPQEVQKLFMVWAKAKDLGRNLGEYIKSAMPNVSDEVVRKLEDFAKEHFVDNKPFEVAGKEHILKKGRSRKVGKWTVKYPDYPREWYDNWTKNTKVEFLKSVGGHYGTTARAFFNQIPWAAEEIYYPWRKAVKVSKNRKRQFRDHVMGPLRKSVSKDSQRRIRDHAIVQQLYKRDSKGNIVVEEGKPVFEDHAAEFMKKNKIKAVPKLDAAEMAVYNEGRRIFDSLYEEINQMRADNGLTPFKKVPDYFTYLRAVGALERVGLGKELFAKRPEKIMKEYARMKELPFRFRHARVKDRVHRLHGDFFETLQTYADIAFDHIHVSPIVAKAKVMTQPVPLPQQRVTKTGLVGKKVFNPLKTKDQSIRDSARYINQWAHKISGVPMKYEAPPRLRKALNKINGNLGAAILGFSMRSMFVQPLALIGAFAEVGGTYLVKGIYDLPSATKYRRAKQKSDVLPTRTPEATIADNLGKLGDLKIGEFPKVARNLSFKGLEIFDSLTAHVTWNAAFRKAREGKVPGVEKMSEIKAARYADDVVVKTQGSGLGGEISPLQYTSWGKTAFMFQTFVINNWNFLAHEVLGLHPSTSIKEALPKVIKYTFAATAANFAFEDLLGMKSPMGRPVNALVTGIEEDNSAFDTALDVAGELLEPVTGFGGVRYGSHILGPVVQRLGDITTGGKYGITPKKEISKWIETGDFPDKTVQLAGELLGIPGTGQAAKIYRGYNRGETPWGMVMGTYDPNRKKSRGWGSPSQWSLD